MKKAVKKSGARQMRLTATQLADRFAKRFGPTPCRIGMRVSTQEWAALDWWRKNAFTDSSNNADVVHLFMLLCLRHPDTIQNWLRGLVRYTQAEGVKTMDWLVRNLEAQPKYRRHRVSV